MSFSRKQVDQQVVRVERTLKSERERCLHGYTFARMYMQLSPKADPAAAEKQLNRYLLVQDSDHGAHQLMGQVYVEQKRYAEAITHFRRSLDIKGDQPELVITVAELYCKLPQETVPLQQLEHWLERLIEVAPYSTAIVSLKEAVLKAKGEEQAGVLEQLLTTQLTHSRDVALHVRLLSLLCAEGQWEKAFERSRLTDLSGLFAREPTWNQKALNVYECFYSLIRSSGGYSPSSEVTVLLSLLRSTARCFLIALREEADCQATCTGLLVKMDKCMLAATRKVRLLPLEAERCTFNHLVVREMGGTLYYLTALHLLACARVEDVDKMMSMAAVCLLACLRAPLPPSSGQWVSGVTLEEAESVRTWAACRLSHTCHLLHLIQTALGGPDSIENSTVRQWSSPEGQAKLLQLLFGRHSSVQFGNSSVKFERKESFLNCDSGLLQLEGAWSQVPSHSDLSGVDKTLVCSNGNNLHAILWLCLNYHFGHQTPPIEEWVQCLFIDLKLSTPNPARISYDTLCQLDMEATLLLLFNHCLEEVGSMVEKTRADGGAQQIATLLSTVFLASVSVKEDLAQFWHNALQLHVGTASAHKLPQVKVFVQSGVAHVRSVKSSPLSMDHLALLGRHFRDRAEKVAEQYQKKPWFFKDVVRDLLQYSCRYWEQIIARLSDPDTPQDTSTIRLYSVPAAVVSVGGADEQQLVEDGHMTLAYLALHRKDPAQALHHYQLARTPRAAFNCAQIYIHLSSQGTGRERGGEKRQDLLLRAQHCLERAIHQLSPGNKTWRPKLNQKLRDVRLMLDEDADIEVLQRLTYGSGDESEDHYLSGYSFSRDDLQSSSQDRMGGVLPHRDMDGSDESSNYRDEDIDWDDEGEESDVDGDDGSESEVEVGREILGEDRDFLARDDSGEEQVISRFIDTRTYSIEDEEQEEDDPPSSVHSFHTDSSGHEVEEFRLSRRSHLDLVRALEGRNNEMQGMRDRIKDLEKEVRMLRKHQPKVPSSGHVYVSPRKAREEGSHSPDGDTPSHPPGTPLRHAPPPSDAGTLASPTSMTTTPGSGGKTAGAKALEGVSPNGAVSMVTPPISLADDTPTCLRPVFEGTNTVVWGAPPHSPTPPSPYSAPPTSLPPPSFFTHVRPPVVVQAQGDQRVPSSMAAMLNRDSLRSLMEPINLRVVSSMSEGHESVEESEEVGETEDDEAPTPDLRHPLMVSAQFTPPRRSTWQCPNCLKGGISSNTCPICHTRKPDSTSKSQPKSKMEVEPSPAGMPIKWNLPSVTSDSSVPLPLSGLNLDLPTPNLSTSLMKQTEESQDGAVEANPEEEADIHFKPVVSLPEKYEVKRGEEEEDVLFMSRAKLYRFEGKEWKERGVGELKMLRNRRSGKVRLLMRRDQVLKICCNHFLSADMALHPMAGSDRAWSWFTSCEFSEGEARAEKLAARFKKPELAMKFKEAFEKFHCPSSQLPLSEHAQGWLCSVCGNENTADIRQCPHCTTQRADRTPADLPRESSMVDQQATPESGNFLSKLTAALESAGASPQTPPQPTASAGVSPRTPLQPTASAGVSPQTPLQPVVTKETDEGKVPEMETGVYPQGRTPQLPVVAKETDEVIITEVEEATHEQKEKAKKFKLPVNFYLYLNRPECPGCRGCTDDLTATDASTDLSIRPRRVTAQQVPEQEMGQSPPGPFGRFVGMSFSDFTQGMSSSFNWMRQDSGGFGSGGQIFGRLEKGEQEGDEDEGNPEEEADIHFKPLVSLPEKYEVKRGEEEEDVLFMSLAKLFRFDGKEWKERGVGELKMLRNRRSGKVRLLMRRDQVLKICCNHFLSADMALHPMAGSDRAWSWFTSCEFSEGEARAETLAARFKNPELAMKFKETFEEAQKYIQGPPALVDDQEGDSVPADAIPELEDDCSVAPDDLEGTLTPPVERQVSYGSDGGERQPTVFIPPTTSHKPPIKHSAQVPIPKVGEWECVQCQKWNPHQELWCISCKGPIDRNKAKWRGVEGIERIEGADSDKLPPKDWNATSSRRNPFFNFPGSVLSDSGAASKQPEGRSEALFNQLMTQTAIKPSPPSAIGGNVAEGMEQQVTEVERTDSSQSTFGQFAVESLPSFESLAGKGVTSNIEWMKRGGAGFSTGSPLFSLEKREEKEEAELNPEEEADIHFKPVVSLPEKYEVKRGEEEEDVVFMSRAKLYRFDTEWKERGVGELKMLRNRRSGKVRLLMRRDQVLKICCNHFLSADMALHPMAGSDRAWSWFTSCEFSEGEARAEKLAARFKNPELAMKFKEAFEEAKLSQPTSELVKTAAELPVSAEVGGDSDEEEEEDVQGSHDTSETSEASEPASELRANVFPNLGHTAPGSWECPSCLVVNGADCPKCPCCGTTTPSAVEQTAVEEEAPPQDHSSLSALTLPQPSADSWSCSTCLVDNAAQLSTCPCCATARPGTKQQTQAAMSAVPPQGPLVIPVTTQQGLFSTLSFPQLPLQPPSAGGGLNIPFPSGQPISGGLNIPFPSGQPISGGLNIPFPSMQPSTSDGQGESNGTQPFGSLGHQCSEGDPAGAVEANPEEEADIHFKPVVSLPEKYEVKRGEEEEDVVFLSRAKMYRFEGKEWKERGVGELKMLRNRRSGKVRLLMRRDQVLKICCNHFLSADMALHPMAGSDTAWSWFTSCEFSEGEARAEKLAARFKNPELAMKFKEAFEEAQKNIQGQEVAQCEEGGQEVAQREEGGQEVAQREEEGQEVAQREEISAELEEILVNLPSSVDTYMYGEGQKESGEGIGEENLTQLSKAQLERAPVTGEYSPPASPVASGNSRPGCNTDSWETQEEEDEEGLNLSQPRSVDSDEDVVAVDTSAHHPEDVEPLQLDEDVKPVSPPHQRSEQAIDPPPVSLGEWSPQVEGPERDTVQQESPQPEEPAKESPVPEKPVKEEPQPEEPAKEEPQPEEPAKEEPQPEEPAKESPVPEEPVKEEPQPEEPVKEEPQPEEPAKEEPLPEEPVKEEPQPEEPVKEETQPEEPAKDEPQPEEPVKEEPQPEEPAKEEPQPEEPVKEEPQPEEPAKEEPQPEEPAKEEPQPEEPAKEEPQPEEPAKDEPQPEDPAKEEEPQPEEPSKESPVPEEPAKDEPQLEDPAKEEEPQPGEPSKESPVPEEPAKEEEPQPEEPSKDEPQPEGPAEEEPQPEEPVKDEPQPEEPVKEEPQPEEPAKEEPLPEEPVKDEPQPEEPVKEEPQPEEPAKDKPPAEEPAKEEPQPEESVKEEPPPEEPVKEEPQPEEPAKESPVPEEPVKEEPQPEEPAKEEPPPEEPVKEEPQPEEPVKEEPPPEEPVKEEPQPEEPAKKKPQPDEPAKESPVPEEPVKEEPQPGEPSKEEPLPEEPSKEEPQPEDPAKEEEPQPEEPSKDEPQPEGPAEEEPLPEEPAEEGVPQQEAPLKQEDRISPGPHLSQQGGTTPHPGHDAT